MSFSFAPKRLTKTDLLARSKPFNNNGVAIDQQEEQDLGQIHTRLYTMGFKKNVFMY